MAALLQAVMVDFGDRHHNLREYFGFRYESVRHLLPTDGPLSEERRLLIGAYFSQEYSIEAAALFNPSMVPDPDQRGVPPGALRFILSLRATGEGHISSIVFRQGTVGRGGTVALDSPTRFVHTPVEIRHSLNKDLFLRKLDGLGVMDAAAEGIVGALPDTFSVDQLTRQIERSRPAPRNRTTEYDRVLRRLLSVAGTSYEAIFDAARPLCERVLFPISPLESHGMEDARFVRFVDDNGVLTYYGTYTAYDGRAVIPQLIATTDFASFRVSTLDGPEVQNKGMALFPRKIQGQFAMISRQDAENLFLMFSDDIHFWHARRPLMKPTNAWEFVQIGNCGSPIETAEGWLVISHGVGPMRRYALGAFLLDLEDPSRVIGRLTEPFLVPNEEEREGYVPNVVYACGGIVHAGQLVLPYAMSDRACSFATVGVDELVGAMQPA